MRQLSRAKAQVQNLCADPTLLNPCIFLSLPSGRLMRILRSVVAPSAAFMAFCDSKITGCSSIRSQIICDELVWDKAIFLQQLAHQFERRPKAYRMVAVREGDNVRRFATSSGVIADVFAPNRPVT